VDTTGNSGADGWQYAPSFRPGVTWRPDCGAGCRVRRRRWVRVREWVPPVTEVPVEECRPCQAIQQLLPTAANGDAPMCAPRPQHAH